MGRASDVGATVGVGGSTVASGITVGGIVGSGVDSITGISVPAQAERRNMNKRIGMIFFIIDFMSLRGGLRRRASKPDEAISS